VNLQTQSQRKQKHAPFKEVIVTFPLEITSLTHI
jgi:hypothetical protein